MPLLRIILDAGGDPRVEDSEGNTCLDALATSKPEYLRSNINSKEARSCLSNMFGLIKGRYNDPDLFLHHIQKSLFKALYGHNHSIAGILVDAVAKIPKEGINDRILIGFFGGCQHRCPGAIGSVSS